MRGEHPAAVVIALAAPKADPEVLLAAVPRVPAVLWAPPGGPNVVGLGIAARVDSGRGGLGALRKRGRALLERIVVLGPRGAPRPRLLGGIAFDAKRSAGRRWAGFPPGLFLLPRWTYVRDRRSAWLLLAVTADARFRPDRRRWLAECDRISRALLRGRPTGKPERGAIRLEAEEAPAFLRAHRQALDAIESGRQSKVVLAHRLGLRAGAPLDVTATVERLRSQQPGCFGYALRLEDATFLGASPERLVQKRGSRVLTEALAGSGPATVGGSKRLLSSRKETREHGFVVRALREALAPFCRRLHVAPRVKIRRLPGIHHLETRVGGTLRGPAHVLDLVEALHPTPAVGGVPRQAALRWIARREEPRGWYAGAFGWFDASGDGEFTVAIRSGLLRGRRADVWAGAGIVRGSVAETEMEEIRRKRSTMLRALGAVES